MEATASGGSILIVWGSAVACVDVGAQLFSEANLGGRLAAPVATATPAPALCLLLPLLLSSMCHYLSLPYPGA